MQLVNTSSRIVVKLGDDFNWRLHQLNSDLDTPPDQHGVLDPRLLRGADEARALFRRLPELGVPVDGLIGQLEEEGVLAFVKSFESLLATLEEKRARMAG